MESKGRVVYSFDVPGQRIQIYGPALPESSQETDLAHSLVFRGVYWLNSIGKLLFPNVLKVDGEDRRIFFRSIHAPTELTWAKSPWQWKKKNYMCPAKVSNPFGIQSTKPLEKGADRMRTSASRKRKKCQQQKRRRSTLKKYKTDHVTPLLAIVSEVTSMDKKLSQPKDVLTCLNESDMRCAPPPVLRIIIDLVGYNTLFQGKHLRTLKGHTGGVYCVSVLPDGRVVSGSWDNTLRLWDMNTGTCVHTLKGHTGDVYCVSVLPDGRVVSGSWDNTLRLWDMNTGTCVRTLKGHTGAVCCVSVLPDGRVVSGSWDKTLRVWC